MHKLMVLFGRPSNLGDFEDYWSGRFVPLAERMPGLRRVAVSRVHGSQGGKVDLHLMHEFYFDNEDALRRALASPEGQAAGDALMSFAGGYAALCFAEHLEEERV